MPTTNWDNLEKQAKENSGNQTFLKITESPTVFVCKGEPYVFYQNFNTKQISENPITGFTWKFKINVAILENNKWTPKIMNGGSTLAGYISQHMKKFGKGHAFSVHKKGKEKNTEYFVMYEKKLEPNDISEIASLKTFNLESKEKSNHSEMPNNLPPPPSDEDYDRGNEPL